MAKTRSRTLCTAHGRFHPDGTVFWLAGSASVPWPQMGPFFEAANSIGAAEIIVMTDQQLALKAMSDAQRILEEYLEPRPHNNERILEKLVDVLERPDVLVAVRRLQRGGF